MKEKFTKPEINVMLRIVTGDSGENGLQDANGNGIAFFDNNDLSAGTVPGSGNSNIPD